MAKETEPCGYVRRILPLPGREEVQMVLRCNRYNHESGAATFSASGQRGWHRATLIEGVTVYFETEVTDEGKTES